MVQSLLAEWSVNQAKLLSESHFKKNSQIVEKLENFQTSQFFDSYTQWGCEIQPFEIRKHLKSRLFEGQISNDLALAIQ